MAKRLVCCPHLDEAEGASLRYLYVDTLALSVEDVTERLEALDGNLRNVCCLDGLVGYAEGTKPLANDIAESLPFEFTELHSFEWFRDFEELRLKTGSAKILYSCLLNYYRREYDGTQQHTFFSEPVFLSIPRDGVEHEMTLENRTMVKKSKDADFVPETLDKGKSMDQKEAEAAAELARIEAEQALLEDEAEALKKEALAKKRKKAQRQREFEAYRDFRNQDDVQSPQFQRFRVYEEEMRENLDYLASEYASDNYASLPGYIPLGEFSQDFESVDNETIGYFCDHKDLFAVASRFDEFGVAYTVTSEQKADGSIQSCVVYTSDQMESAHQAVEFYELEKQFSLEKVIPADRFYSAFQLQALDFAYENAVDTAYIDSGHFNGGQMYRIVEAGLDGCDMSVVANPDYSTAHMDALHYFMHQNWDTAAIREPGMPMSSIADCVFREERNHGVPEDSKFFAHHDFDAFVASRQNDSIAEHSDRLDSVYQNEASRHVEPMSPGSQDVPRGYHDESRGFGENVHRAAVGSAEPDFRRDMHNSTPQTPTISPTPRFTSSPAPESPKDIAGSGDTDGSGSPMPHLPDLQTPSASYNGKSHVSGPGKFSHDASRNTLNADQVVDNNHGSIHGGVHNRAGISSHIDGVPFDARDGRSYMRDSDGTLWDGRGKAYCLDGNGYPMLLKDQPARGEYPFTAKAGVHGVLPTEAPKTSVSGSPAVYKGPDGRSYLRSPDGTLRDASGKAYRPDANGQPKVMVGGHTYEAGHYSERIVQLGGNGQAASPLSPCRFTGSRNHGSGQIVEPLTQRGDSDLVPKFGRRQVVPLAQGDASFTRISRALANGPSTIYKGPDGGSYLKSSDGTLRDASGKTYRLDANGQLKLVGSGRAYNAGHSAEKLIQLGTGVSRNTVMFSDKTAGGSIPKSRNHTKGAAGDSSNIFKGPDGRFYAKQPDGTLRDSKGAFYVLDKAGQPRVINGYTPKGGYTPTGYVDSNGQYQNGFKYRRSSVSVPDGSRAEKNGRVPQGTPNDKNPVNRRKRPLDELRVRSSFAERSGYRIQRFGSRALQTGGQLARYSKDALVDNVVQSDETGSLSLIRKSVRNVVFTAQVIHDLPLMFAKPGTGISYTAGAIQQAGSSLPGSSGNSQTQYLPLREKPWADLIESTKKAHFKSLRKQFGEQALYLNYKQIDKQIEICSAELAAAREKFIPINQQLKAQLKGLHPAATLMGERDALIAANRNLKAEIQALQRKGSLTNTEKNLLAKKIQQKQANEALIQKKSNVINQDVQKAIGEKNRLIRENRGLKSEIKNLKRLESMTPEQKKRLEELLKKKAANEKAIAKKVRGISEQKKVLAEKQKKASELYRQKKQNEGILASKGRKVKDLKRLKAKKLEFDKTMKGLSKNFDAARAAERRLKSIPGKLTQKLVQALYKSGDRTLTGIGQATSYTMSFARNPIVRLLVRKAPSFARKSATVAVKAAKATAKGVAGIPKGMMNAGEKIKAVAAKAKPAAKAAANIKHFTGPKGWRAKSFANTKSLDSMKQFGQKNPVKMWIKRANAKFLAVARAKMVSVKTFFSAAKGAGAVGGAVGSGAAASAGAALLFVIFFVLLISMFSSMGGSASSFVLTDEETDDGRIDLSAYVDIINDSQAGLQEEIQNIANGINEDTGKHYDNVFYDYAGTNNTRQMLAMAYVRFGFDLTDKDAVKTYLEQLYQDSNFVDYAESDLYSCDNGCVERSYKCYDEPDDFATTARVSLYEASDHSDNRWAEAAKGCTFVSYSCMSSGHSVYNRHGCSRHNEGRVMTEPGSCNNYTVEDTGYYCQGHCSGKHRDYSCPGHTETVCYGEHQDITITITSLGFDDIFHADSSLAADGSYVRGDAYEEQFTITAYCSCHECCHPYDPECTGQPSKTASGTTPKANHTIAVDPDVIPLGTHVWINGKEYVAEDTGGAIDGYDIDMYFDSHQEALNWGVRKLTVYKAKPVESDSEETEDEYGFDGWTEDNIETVKTIYEGLTNEEANEVYAGLDGIQSLIYGSYDGNFDFSGVIFEELDMDSLTQLQKNVLAVIDKNQVETRKGYCLAWVSNVCMYAGAGPKVSKCCSNHAGEAWGVSNDWSTIQVGAAVYGWSRSLYGHTGIYIGNGMVAHNIGYRKIEPLEKWVNTYNGVCWGWHGGYNLTGNSAYNCKPAGTFMHGKD